MNQTGPRLSALFLALFMLLSLAACGGGENTTATMHLVKAEGTVRVDDTKGKSVQLMENLGLFSGYRVATQAVSYGWINMDDTKLAKLDENSETEIQKEDKLLELYVRSGNLFFNVTKPLKEDETMNIRTSTMLVGVRDACGWVEVEDESLMCVYLLKGQVECTVLDKDGGVLASETITAGQAAKMEMIGSITVAEFDTKKAPAFVAEALSNSNSWQLPQGQAGVQTETAPGNDTPLSEEAVAAALESYRDILSRADSYFTHATPVGEYQYALIQLQPTDYIPTLLLQVNVKDQIDMLYTDIRYFQYLPDRGFTLDGLSELADGQGDFALAGDGNGLLCKELLGYNNEVAKIYRITMETGFNHSSDQLYNGPSDAIPAELLDTREIPWHDLSDLSLLDNWSPAEFDTQNVPTFGRDEAGEEPSSTAPEPVLDVIRLRDMYTYSRTLGYVNGELVGEGECFPDEQGRIGRYGDTVYIYNEEGTLQALEADNGVIYTVTENTADHRKMVREDMDWAYIEYYDEQGHETRQELFANGEMFDYRIFTYDAEGKLIRSDRYLADGSLDSYILYAYD